MRDLKADLEICNKAMTGPWVRKYENNIKQAVSDRGICSCSYSSNIDSAKTAQENSDNMEFIAQSREGWPHAIERAIKAEAEVERLRLMVKSITGGLDEAIETNHYLENELVKYNLAFKLACKSLDETQKNYFTPGGWSLETTFLKQAKRELENG